MFNWLFGKDDRTRKGRYVLQVAENQGKWEPITDTSNYHLYRKLDGYGPEYLFINAQNGNVSHTYTLAINPAWRDVREDEMVGTVVMFVLFK